MSTGVKWAIILTIFAIIFLPATVGKIVDTGTTTIATAVQNRDCG